MAKEKKESEKEPKPYSAEWKAGQADRAKKKAK